MKRFLNLFALVACFTFLAATTTTAQNIVRNSTACPMRVIVAYGDAATCTVFGTLDVTVAPASGFFLPMPPGTSILASKGYYLPGTSPCVYYVSTLGCFSYGPVDNVSCGSGCGNYTAELTGFGLWLHN